MIGIIKKSIYIIKNEGFITLSIIILTKLKKKSKQEKKSGIHFKTSIEELCSVDLNRKIPKWKGLNKEKFTFAWIMPPPGKGSGGHITLFRYIKYLENEGHENIIYFHNPGINSKISHVLDSMGDSFPKLKARMFWLYDINGVINSDAIFATSWETAYTVYNIKNSALKLYFVQDFEPYFYPVGSFYAFAENTYKMNLVGITAGKWLANKLSSEYSMRTKYFDFGVDLDTYKLINKNKRKDILCYVRPTTERRGFELAIATLYILSKKYPKLRIHLVGWDLSIYNIPFKYIGHSILEHNELNLLYNKCKAGLVISMTNFSLLPLELLGAGCVPLVTDGPNNEMVENNPNIHYAAHDPLSLARRMEAILNNNRYDPLALNKSVQNKTWDSSGKKFIIEINNIMKGGI